MPSADRSTIEAWLKEHKISEVECLVPDMTGNARGKFIPAHQFTASRDIKLPESIMIQTVTGDKTDLFSLVDLFVYWRNLFLILLLTALWTSPLLTWFLYCSSWSRRTPLVAALTIPVVIILLDSIFSTQINLGGMIADVNRRKSKRGDWWATLMLEDLQGQIDVLVFPKTYQAVEEQLQSVRVELDGERSRANRLEEEVESTRHQLERSKKKEEDLRRLVNLVSDKADDDLVMVDGEPLTIELRDDGQGADEKAGDGILSGEVTWPASGHHAVFATVRGRTPAGRTFRCDGLEQIEVRG